MLFTCSPKYIQWYVIDKYPNATKKQIGIINEYFDIFLKSTNGKDSRPITVDNSPMINPESMINRMKYQKRYSNECNQIDRFTNPVFKIKARIPPYNVAPKNASIFFIKKSSYCPFSPKRTVKMLIMKNKKAWN